MTLSNYAKKTSVLRKVLWAIFPIVAALIINGIIGYPFNYIIDRYIFKFKTKYLSCEIISLSKLNNESLKDYANNELLTPFNLKLDDPILTDYYIYKIKLTNKGTSISNSIKFNASIKGQFAKIIDIKAKYVAPSNKELLISTSLPNLIWSMDEVRSIGGPGKLKWDTAGKNSEFIVGRHVYRSKLKDVGYGRINEKIIIGNTYPIFDFPMAFSRQYYYALQEVYIHGERSGISTYSVPSVYLIPFMSFFKNVSYIIPKTIDDNVDVKLKRPLYRFAKDAVNDGYYSTLIVSADREDYKHLDKSAPNLDNANNIYFSDDLKFLHGEADIKILNGLDDGAVINIYILVKSYPIEQIKMNFLIQGEPEIKYDMKQGDDALINKSIDNNVEYDPIKYSLTPRMANLYYGRNSVYIIWEKPNSKEYGGVRIFKKEIGDKTSSHTLGQEIYDGTGEQSELICGYYQTYGPNQTDDIFNEEPPVKISERKKKTPSAPKMFSIGGDEPINVSDNVVNPYYRDKKIQRNKRYQYTIFAYDNNRGRNSYPIDIILNTADKFILPYCP